MSGDRVGGAPAPLVIYGNIDVTDQVRHVQNSIYSDILADHHTLANKAKRNNAPAPAQPDLPHAVISQAANGTHVKGVYDRIEIDALGRTVIHLDSDRGALPSEGQNAIDAFWNKMQAGQYSNATPRAYMAGSSGGTPYTHSLHQGEARYSGTHQATLPRKLTPYTLTAYENGAVTLSTTLQDDANRVRDFRADFDQDGLDDRLILFDPHTSMGKEFFGMIVYADQPIKLPKDSDQYIEKVYYYDINGDGITDESRSYARKSDGGYIGKFTKLRRYEAD